MKKMKNKLIYNLKVATGVLVAIAICIPSAITFYGLAVLDKLFNNLKNPYNDEKN